MEKQPITREAFKATAQTSSGLSLIFAPGKRPGAPVVERLSATRVAGPGSFCVSHMSNDGSDWLELLTSGLTFDLTGLAPGSGAPLPKLRHVFGMTRDEAHEAGEAVDIIPGPHLASAAAMMPVVRAQVGLGCELAQLPDVKAVCWHVSGSWMSPDYFMRMVEQWLIGGAFPALGLTALKRTVDGGVESEGMAFFIGKECRIEPDISISPADSAKLAIRVIHHLMEGNQIESPTNLTGPSGERLQLEPSKNGRYVRVWRLP